MLSLLLRATDEDGQPMSRPELRDELVTVLAAGHETTATSVAWAFERLPRTARVLGRLTESLSEGDEYLDATINIQFEAVGVVGQPAIDWQNRPTFQQVVQFPAHRPG